MRARYWKEALQVFEAHPALGAGAEGYWTAHLRYATETLEVRHAHGFIVQTLADLGLVGPGGRARAAARVDGRGGARDASVQPPLEQLAGVAGDPPRRAPRLARAGRADELARYTPERVGMLCMLCVVVVFGVHSLIDWTWYVPGDACVALLCAGWLAGRGELGRGDAAGGRPRAQPPPPAKTDTGTRSGVALGTGSGVRARACASPPRWWWWRCWRRGRSGSHSAPKTPARQA